MSIFQMNCNTVFLFLWHFVFISTIIGESQIVDKKISYAIKRLCLLLFFLWVSLFSSNRPKDNGFMSRLLLLALVMEMQPSCALILKIGTSSPCEWMNVFFSISSKIYWKQTKKLTLFTDSFTIHFQIGRKMFS